MLKDALEHSIVMARRMKSMRCQRGPADIKASIEAYRGHDPVAVIVMQHHRRDEILGAAAMAAAGFEADILSVTFETYVDGNRPGLTNINPLTGNRWRAGEMQQVAEKHQGVERGWVIEAICIGIVNRAGDSGGAKLTYKYLTSAFTAYPVLSWMGTTKATSMDADNFGGYMHDVLLKAMLDPFTNMPLPGSDEIGRDRRDVLTVRTIAETLECQGMLFTSADDSARLNVLMNEGDPL